MRFLITFFDVDLKKIFKVKLVLFSIFDAKRRKNGPKNQTNVVSKCVLDLHFAPIKGSVFLKKVKFSSEWCGFHF
jgi:hypothetical protein